MSTSSTIHRNKPIGIYTTQTAELDIALYNICDDLLGRICHSLSALPISDEDEIRGSIRYRVFGKLEVVYQLSSTPEELIVDICGIRPRDEAHHSEKVLEILDQVAKYRGILGV